LRQQFRVFEKLRRPSLMQGQQLAHNRTEDIFFKNILRGALFTFWTLGHFLADSTYVTVELLVWLSSACQSVCCRRCLSRMYRG